jgi:hypothetical protein
MFSDEILKNKHAALWQNLGSAVVIFNEINQGCPLVYSPSFKQKYASI